ncbi:MAG: hypothetical protein J5843_01670 [Clostridia bacterium]|nr:hypothetical protein [Clostridia bacterium]
MEKSTWVKIVSGLLIAAVIARIILAFFPVPLPIADYSADGTPGELQGLTVTEIERCFTALSYDGKACWFYRIRLKDGSEGFLKSSKNFLTEKLTEPPANDEDRDPAVSYWADVTGMSVRLPDSAAGTTEEQTRFWESITFVPEYLEANDGNVNKAYEPFRGKVALDMDYTTTTEDNPACLWVNILCAVLFVWVLALLLSEYISIRRRPKEPEPDEFPMKK